MRGTAVRRSRRMPKSCRNVMSNDNQPKQPKRNDKSITASSVKRRVVIVSVLTLGTIALMYLLAFLQAQPDEKEKPKPKPTLASVEAELAALRKEVAKYSPENVDVDKTTYTWKNDGIHTSDGRFFPLKRENIVDEDGKPLIILEARPDGSDMPSRAKMSEAQLTEDFWARLQDQQIETLALVPSKFDNEGDLRMVFVTLTQSELDFLKLEEIERYRLKNGRIDKIAVPIWVILKNQEKLQTAPVEEPFRNKLKKLRDTEIPKEPENDSGGN